MKKIHNFVHILRSFNGQSAYPNPTSMERSKNLNLSKDKWKMWVNKPNKRYRSAASMGSFLIRFIGRASTAAVVFASAFSSFTFFASICCRMMCRCRSQDVDPKCLNAEIGAKFGIRVIALVQKPFIQIVVKYHPVIVHRNYWDAFYVFLVGDCCRWH